MRGTFGMDKIDNDVEISTKIENNWEKQLKDILAKQIRYDKAHHNLKSTDFSGSNKNNLIDYSKFVRSCVKPVSKYLDADLGSDLSIEDGVTYKKDVKDENDGWYEENDPNDMDAGYRKWIKHHQDYFSPKKIYPIADDIDFYPSPLTHIDLWNYVNGNPEKVHTRVYDDIAGNVSPL